MLVHCTFKYATKLTSCALAFAADLSPQNLVQLLATNPTTNVLIALSSSQTPLTTLAAEFGLALPPPNTPLVSHFPRRPEPHTVLEIPVTRKAHPLFRKGISPIAYEGVAFALGDNPRGFSILNAPAESFSSDTKSDDSADSLYEVSEKGGEGLWAGSKMSVASGFQTSTGARVGWVGSVKAFSNEFASKTTSR